MSRQQIPTLPPPQPPAESVEDARERLASAIEAADIGTFYCPVPLREIVWNDKCKEHFWLPADAEVDFDVFYSRLHPDDRERTRREIVAAVFAGAPYDVEYRTLSPTGEMRWIRAKGRTAFDATGKPTRFDGITIDISSQKQLEAQRDRLLERERLQKEMAQNASDMKDTFIASVSHELRAPLTAVLAWVDLLERRVVEEEFVKHGVSVIRRNIAAQTRLVDDLLEVSRITAGKLAVRKAAINLAQPARAELDNVRPLAEKKGVTITDQLGAGALVPGDPTRLRQVFANVLSNALKYTPSGGDITVAMREVDGYAELSVADTGEGIPKNLLNTIFEPFAQVDGSTTRKHGGLGLGLAIARSIVAMHNGTLTAFSDGVGTGATFTIRMPLETGRQVTPAAPASSPDGSEARLPVAGMSVLVVDDDEDTLDAFAMLFEHERVAAYRANSAMKARQVLAERAVDVIFSDISMPGEDGHQFISGLRATGNRTPAIAVTAFVRDEDRERARAAGFDEHVGKPVPPQRLVELLAKHRH
jgi:signal transduction histidine kinase